MLAMSLLAEIATVRAHIDYLKFALKDCTDTRIREVIEFRLHEQRLMLHQLESTQRSISPQTPSPERLRPRKSP
jgi:hypothetical protein